MAKPSNLLILDEPTNDLDVETLDLLQEILDGYDGSVILVSHDRDFLDLVATTTVAMEGNGNAVVYAGGWSDYQIQRKVIYGENVKIKKKGKVAKIASEDVSDATNIGLSFTQKHRLETLPALMEKLESEIVKLQEFMSDPDLFMNEPEKFQKATDGLIDRQAALDAAEEEWLELDALAEGEK
jgi:ATP-binding cassette subfamily F protein uup